MDLNIKIVYSKRKTVGINVKEGVVTIRSPKGKSSDELLGILKKHERWLSGALSRDKARYEKIDELDSLDEKELRAAARVYFTEKCEHYAAIMGLKYNKISINKAKGRFGSCSSLGNINFSLRLMLYPEEAREYVVVHELCHLKYMNHSKFFYSYLSRYMPDYKERRKLLRVNA